MDACWMRLARQCRRRLASTLRCSVPLFVLAAAVGTALNLLLAFEQNDSGAEVSLRASASDTEGKGLGLRIPPSISRAGLTLSFYPYPSSGGEGNDDDGQSQGARGARPKPKPKMLIAQYDAGSAASSGYYQEILNATSAINRAYAERYGNDYLLLRGFYLLPPRIPMLVPKWLRRPTGEQNENVATSLATYNKLAVLRLALENPELYDFLLMLDSDAMVVDFAADVVSKYSYRNSYALALRT